MTDEGAAHITRLGATIVRVPGDYHYSVEAAAKAASQDGWIAVPDTLGPGEDDTACTFVVQGSAVLTDEIVATPAGQRSLSTHVVIQAGVGGLAASVFGHGRARELFEPNARLLVVEPERSACVYESARAGTPVRLPPGPPTNMSMLECQSPVPDGLPLINSMAMGFPTVTDEDAGDAVRLLDRRTSDDLRLAWASQVRPGLAGLVRAAENGDRARLALDQSSKVLLFATEGPTGLSVWSGSP